MSRLGANTTGKKAVVVFRKDWKRLAQAEREKVRSIRSRYVDSVKSWRSRQGANTNGRKRCGSFQKGLRKEREAMKGKVITSRTVLVEWMAGGRGKWLKLLGKEMWQSSEGTEGARGKERKHSARYVMLVESSPNTQDKLTAAVMAVGQVGDTSDMAFEKQICL